MQISVLKEFFVSDSSNNIPTDNEKKNQIDINFFPHLNLMFLDYWSAGPVGLTHT